MSPPVSSEVEFGLAILSAVISSTGEDWANLSDAHRDNAKAVTMDYGALVLRAALGEDVTEALVEVGVALGQWTWIGSDVARRAMLEAAQTALSVGASVALAAAGI